MVNITINDDSLKTTPLEKGKVNLEEVLNIAYNTPRETLFANSKGLAEVHINVRLKEVESMLQCVKASIVTAWAFECV